MDDTKQVITFSLPSDLKLGPNAIQVIQCRFDNPQWTLKQIGEHVGICQQRVSQLLNHPRVLKALPAIAKQRIKGMVPKAARAYEDLLTHENAIVKERAAAKILTENKVFDAPDSITRLDITLKSVSELRAIVDRAASLPSNVIEAEVIEETQAE